MTPDAPRPAEAAAPPDGDQAPPFGISRLLLVVTGSASAVGVPQWLGWLRTTYPRLEVRVVMSRAARRFVTPTSLELRLETDVEIDDWEECRRARHVEYAEWAEAVLVYPATFHFTARLALGLADTPVLLALQCTDALVAVAPSLPPGGLDSPAFRSHWAALAARPRVVLVPPAQGHSLTTGREDGWVPPPLTEALRRIEDRRTELAPASDHPAADGATAVTALFEDGART
ncbi:flavoprotein [Streptomyces lincolnensis]|uniref:flavoprotein n=1 Tax=Streptomyces lincolnensis TaxID=1915 RepID=UPI0037CFC6A5